MALRSAALVVASFLFLGSGASAQTPSPFAYWQNAAGIVLAPLAGPVPEWRAMLGMGIAQMPAYEGSTRYLTEPAPEIDVRYRDIAFASVSDGVGVNLIRGKTYRAGIAVGYDTGRDRHVQNRLNGLRNIDPAAEPRLFAEIGLLPVVVTLDVRRAIGGHNGVIGDIGAYVPVVGREDLVVFVGPSVTFANERYMQSYFGISTADALGSRVGFHRYNAQGGLKNANLGLVAVYNFTDQWFADATVSWERLADSAGNSPIVQDRNQIGVALTVEYEF
jgi:outer membrane scaffolding protein for murein synthesis (MipA/OmpV family)